MNIGVHDDIRYNKSILHPGLNNQCDSYIFAIQLDVTVSSVIV